jgi:serine/threonine protein kinase
MRGGVVSKTSSEPLNDHIHRILSQSTFHYISCGTYGFVFRVTYLGAAHSGFINPETGEEVREFVIKVQSLNMGMSYKGESDHVSSIISWDKLTREVSLQKKLYETSLEKFGNAVCPAILYYEGLTLNQLETYIKDQFIYKFHGIIPQEHYDSYNVAIILMEFVPSSDLNDALNSLPTKTTEDHRAYWRRLQDLKNKAFTIYCMTLLCGINQNDVFGRNFLLDKNDRVTIIDFGVAGELDTKTLTVIEGLVDACRANLSDKKALRELKVYLISLDPTLNDWLFQRGYSTQPYSTELLDFPLSLPDKVVESCKSGLCNPMNTEPKRIAKNERKRDRYDDELEARKLDKLEEENDRKRDRGGKRHTKYVGTRKKTRTRRKV